MATATPSAIEQGLCCYGCGSGDLHTVFTYDAPPEGETRFSFSDENYRRSVLRCTACGHFVSISEMDVSQMYTQEYVDSTYGGDRFRRTFDRIIALDPSKSDNAGRCRRIVDYAEQHLTAPRREGRPPTILDVGSGLCVFLHGMKSYGWRGVALDPDQRAAVHAREVVGVESVCGDFFQCDDLGRFDVVTINKVLEHVQDPVAMLARSRRFLADGGFVYVELPDGEIAARHGSDREEFYVEHLHAFSLTSLALVAAKAGFDVQTIERLQEPSTKFTLRAFLTVA